MPTMPKEYSRVAKREQRARESILKTGLLPYQDSFLAAVTRRITVLRLQRYLSVVGTARHFWLALCWQKR